MLFPERGGQVREEEGFYEQEGKWLAGGGTASGMENRAAFLFGMRAEREGRKRCKILRERCLTRMAFPAGIREA
jgi:hypothetical protein